MAGIVKLEDGFAYINHEGKPNKERFATKAEAKEAYPTIHENKEDKETGGNPSIGQKTTKAVKKVAKKATKKVAKKKK